MAAFLPAVINAAGSVASGYLAGRSSGSETKMQRTKRKLVDKVLSSLDGDGPYSDIFNFDQDSFNKSFVEPAKNLFNNQIAPQIQQQYLATGQQRNSGLDDQLLRAGVNIDDMLNQYLMQYQEAGKNRSAQAINSIYGAGDGGTQPMGAMQALNQGVSGYLSSDSFSNGVSNLFSNKQAAVAPPAAYQPRAGFQQDWRQWNNAGLTDSRWGN